MIQESCGMFALYQWLLYVHPHMMLTFTCMCDMLWNSCTAFPILPPLWLSKPLSGLMEWPLYFWNKVSIHMSIFQQPLFKWIFIYVCRILGVNQAFIIKKIAANSFCQSIHPSICLSIYPSACLPVYLFLSVHPSIFLISSISSILWFRLLPIPSIHCMTAFIFCSSSCIFLHFVLHLIYQSTNVFNKIQFITCIKLIHVSAPGCHPQGVFLNKGYRPSALICVLHYLYSND